MVGSHLIFCFELGIGDPLTCGHPVVGITYNLVTVHVVLSGYSDSVGTELRPALLQSTWQLYNALSGRVQVHPVGQGVQSADTP